MRGCGRVWLPIARLLTCCPSLDRAILTLALGAEIPLHAHWASCPAIPSCCNQAPFAHPGLHMMLLGLRASCHPCRWLAASSAPIRGRAGRRRRAQLRRAGLVAAVAAGPESQACSARAAAAWPGRPPEQRQRLPVRARQRGEPAGGRGRARGRAAERRPQRRRAAAHPPAPAQAAFAAARAGAAPQGVPAAILWAGGLQPHGGTEGLPQRLLCTCIAVSTEGFRDLEPHWPGCRLNTPRKHAVCRAVRRVQGTPTCQEASESARLLAHPGVLG